jgi:5,10-methylenetetrahydromethanopterin reductase
MRFDVGILATEPVPEIVRQVQLAEALGYDTAWITDTHLVCRELWVTLAACAQATTRIRLGPGVTVPHTRHATTTASAVATLADLAPGRTVIGLGTGGSSAQTMGLTIEQTARVATLEALTTTIRRLTRGESIRLETGVEARLAWLPGPRSIPIHLAASGPRMLRAAGRLGDGAIVYASVVPAILGAAVELVAEGAREAGRDPASLDVGLWAPMSIHRDRALARDHARGRVASALRHPLPVRLADEDERAIAEVRRAYDAFQHATAASRHRTLVPDRLVDLFALAGAPGEVADQVRAIAEMGTIDRVIILPQAPGDGFIARDAILRLFAEDVIARVS